LGLAPAADAVEAFPGLEAFPAPLLFAGLVVLVAPGLVALVVALAALGAVVVGKLGFEPVGTHCQYLHAKDSACSDISNRNLC
jgi:hypothetical protein